MSYHRETWSKRPIGVSFRPSFMMIAQKFHDESSKIVNFCVNDLGSLYLDVIKDRLYTMQPESEGRRSAQYALAIVLDFLNKAISPILPFTAYEFSENLSNGNGDKIFYSEWEEYENKLNKEEEEEFELLVQLRQRAYQEIEEERKKKDIKNAFLRNGY